VIVCYPAQGDSGRLLLGEPNEHTIFLPCPLDFRLLMDQIKTLLRRRLMERDLRSRLTEREDVLRSISEVFFSVDREFRYTFFNEKAEQVGGKAADQLIGKNMWETFPFLKNTEFHRQMEQAAKDRRMFSAEYMGPITGGCFDMRIFPSAGGLSVLFVDITARKKTEEALKRTQEQLLAANGNLERAVEERTAQLHAANERLEELLYSIAHDLRSPLRSMQGFAQAFVEDFASVQDEQARVYAQRMTCAALLMDRMLGDLIELSRVTKTELELRPVSLADTWKCATAQLEEKIKKTEARIHAAPELGQVTANPTLLAQVMSNLLGNALKFTRQGVRPEIKLWTEPLENRFLGIYVEDNGIGIDPRYHERIFRVFERLNGSEYEGTGIGLAIARKAVERMKGQLDFSSVPGAGTKFCVKLPVRLGL
jgi:PAS domain S-box-containing protein